MTSVGGSLRRGNIKMHAGGQSSAAGAKGHPIDYLDGTQEALPASGGDGHRGSTGGGGRVRSSNQIPHSAGQEGCTSSDNDSTPGSRRESNRSGSSASPFDSTEGGGSGGAGSNAGGGPRSASSAGSGGGAVHSVPGVATRPATVGNVPFGASALSKTVSNGGRSRPRGLRPRGLSSGSFASSSSSRVNMSSMPYLSRSSAGGVEGSFSSGSNGRVNSRITEEERERMALAVAEEVAPGVSMETVVMAAVKVESVMRVLIARGYVRRKLVSEVTAFSLIMERGIEVIKHPFSGKGKPKNVTVNFVTRKGAMQLSWGGKSGVPLETIFGVTKGIKTEALSRVVGPDRAENCFSLLTSDRTIDFEVDNPWLILLVVRAMRLFLGAHYDTLPAPTFFSHLCVRSRGSSRMDSPKQTLVWTGDGEKASQAKDMASSPTERTSGDSMDSDSDEASGGGDGSGGRSPWARIEKARASNGGGSGEDDATYAAPSSTSGDTDGASSTFVGGTTPPPPPDHDAPGADSVGSIEAEADLGDIYGEHERGGEYDEECKERSPGGIMALFSNGRRPGDPLGLGGLDLSGAAGQYTMEGAGERPPEEEQPLTASQVLATRGATKRLNLSKRLSGPKETGAALKGKRFNLMALPADSHHGRQERGISLDLENLPKRTQGMSISIGAGYNLPEEQNRTGRTPDPERIAIVDDLNDKLQSLRKLCIPQQRIGHYRPGSKQPKTMAVKHMAFFQGVGESVVGGGLGSVAEMWGDGVRRQYQTDMVRQKNESVEDVLKRDDVRTAMLVNRSGVHRVTRKPTGSMDPR